MENSEKNIHEEIVDRLVIKVDELEKREVKVPDYTPQLESLTQSLNNFVQRYTNDNDLLKNSISQLNMGKQQQKLQAALAETKIALDAINKALPVKLHYSFDFRTRGWIIAGMALLIATAISTGLSGYLWKENSSLEAVNIKYRLAKQISPVVMKWVDSIYLQDPEKVKRTLLKMENGRLNNNKPSKKRKEHKRTGTDKFR